LQRKLRGQVRREETIKKFIKNLKKEQNIWQEKTERPSRERGDEAIHLAHRHRVLAALSGPCP
jgi:hypothetical protein